jgi:benzodiazapine receptor
MTSLIVVLSVLATLVVNGLANALPINGQTTAEISDRFPVLFTPAGYVFAIWGLIYLGLIAFAIYQALPRQRDNPRLARSRPWLALSGLANIAWLLLWHYEQFPLTMLAMLVLLGLLILTYLRLEIGVQAVGAGERWLAQLPISIYLGWVSVATIANASVFLVDQGWASWGLSASAWTAIMIAAAVVIGSAMVLRRREVAFPLVLVWAFTGIGVRNVGLPLVQVTASVAGALMLTAALWSAFRRPRQLPTA